jgi:hypothetical protein
MKLKCIGGLANGRIEEVDNYLTEHDIVRIRAIVQFSIPSFEEDVAAFREGRPPDYLTIPYHFYKIATLHFPDKTKLNFLIPERMTAKDALCFVLGA